MRQELNIKNSLNRTLLIVSASSLIGFIFGYISFILAIGAAMTPSPDNSIFPETFFLLIIFLVILPFLISFFAPIWYFFIRKSIINSKYTKVSIFFILLGGNIISTIMVMILVGDQRLPGSIELIPYYILISIATLILMRIKLIFMKTTKNRSDNINYFIQFIFLYLLIMNLVFTSLSNLTNILGVNIENILILETLIIIFVIVLYLILPLSFLILFYYNYKNYNIINKFNIKQK